VSCCTCPATHQTSILSRSANHNAPSDTNCPIIGLEGLLGLLALVERLQAAHISEGEEGRQCRPQEQFPPVHSRQRAASSVEGASTAQSQAASGEPQPSSGTPLRGTRHNAAEGGGGP
jgi:hypothetical protein